MGGVFVVSHLNHARRSGPGGERSQIARRRVMSMARRIASASMPVSVISQRSESLVCFGCVGRESQAVKHGA
jgi:hypothetical protein